MSALNHVGACRLVCVPSLFGGGRGITRCWWEKQAPKAAKMTAAANVLRDTLESRWMPSGLPLAPDAAQLHERAAWHLEKLVRAAGAQQPRPIGEEDQA